MQERHLKIKSKADGLDLDVLIFYPEGTPKGLFQISHGMAEHKERYIPFMEFMAGHGYITLIHDHRGHGESVRSKEDYGHFGDETANAIVQDLHDLSQWLQIQYPHLPLILFGHSMGSLVARKYLKLYDKDIAKLILCGSPSANPAAGLGKKLVKLLMKIKGDRHRSALINSLAVGGYDKKVPGTGTNRWLSANPDNVQEFNLNEKDGFVFTLNGFHNLFTLLEEVYSDRQWALKHPDLPILFIAGADDPVILNEKAWKEAQGFLKKVGYTNVSGILYPGLRHELLLEKEAHQVMEDILHFVES